MYYLIVPLNKIGSWGMIDNLLLNTSNSNFEMSIPSILIIPSQISTNRNRATTKELLPDPVRPTMPENDSQLISCVRKRDEYIKKIYALTITNFLSRFYTKWDIDQYERQLLSVSHLNSFELYFTMRGPIIGWFKSNCPACAFLLQSLKKIM